MSNDFTTAPAYFDSRDAIERIEELENDEDTLTDEDLADELQKLQAFAEGASGAADWEDGVTFIRDDEFEEYAIEYASEMSSEIDPKLADSWPFCHIDWKAAAKSLQQDFTSYEFRAETYWARA